MHLLQSNFRNFRTIAKKKLEFSLSHFRKKVKLQNVKLRLGFSDYHFG